MARRLAFLGEQMHAESGGRQHPDDPGLLEYWKDPRTGQIRPHLEPGGAGLQSLPALAELGTDPTEEGMYPSARLLRNAGTHRIVHATEGEPTGPTRGTFSTVSMRELHSAALEALQVVRAAYLYFVDLIDSQHVEESKTATVYSLPNQE